MTVVDIDFNTFLDAYLQESLDRQVMRMLNVIPEMAKDKSDFDENRAKVSFNLNKTAYDIVMFNAYIKNNVIGIKPIEEYKNALDNNYIRLQPNSEDLFQLNLKVVQKVDSYQQ